MVYFWKHVSFCFHDYELTFHNISKLGIIVFFFMVRHSLIVKALIYSMMSHKESKCMLESRDWPFYSKKGYLEIQEVLKTVLLLPVSLQFFFLGFPWHLKCITLNLMVEIIYCFRKRYLSFSSICFYLLNTTLSFPPEDLCSIDEIWFRHQEHATRIWYRNVEKIKDGTKAGP